MSKFTKTDIAKYLLYRDVIKAIPIHLITTEAVDEFLKGLSSSQTRWAKDNKFNAAKDEFLILAGIDGEITAILAGIGSNKDSVTLSSIAPLAKGLPNENYFIANKNYDYKQLKLLAIGWAIAQYDFDHYQNKKNNHKAVLMLDNQGLFDDVSTIINGISLTRDLVNTPTSDMGPSHLSDVMQNLAEQFKANFSAIIGDELLEENFNTIHAVGRAADNQPRLLELNWGREDAPKLTLVGKGVCFDSGGLDIKSAAGMRIMKKDMGGAAHTLGLAQMIMTTGLDVRLRLLIPAVENSISANAFRPGDIIKTYKGTTVEIDNTDAEGRLVLCDALALASEENPDLLINFATLTGAARVAMGPDVVPFFTDSDEIAESLATHSVKENDPIWRLPLHAPYEIQLQSTVADLSNMGSGPFGGAIIAALFLKHFVEEPQKWLHFDMYAWNMSNKPTCPEGGEAMAIRAIFAYLKERFG